MMEGKVGVGGGGCQAEVRKYTGFPGRRGGAAGGV
jgi:hypothetical protein